MKMLVKRHALQRAHERFPSGFMGRDTRSTADVLVAIAHRGTPVGQSAVVGQRFRQGRVGPHDVVVVVKATEPVNGEEAAVVVTCMSPEEMQHNGNNLARNHDDP